MPREKATHPKSLTYEQAQEIRRRYWENGDTQVSLAIEHNISQAGISAIITGKSHQKPVLVMTREEELERRRQRNYFLKYGITYDDWQEMVAEAKSSCQSCGKHQDAETPHPRSGKPSLRLDHDHSTGKPRGVLCNSCNLILGHAGDSIERLEGLVAYLKKARL